MDKVKLNRQQLQEVVIYIERRGFRDPLEIAEILDHFACKIEEKMEANPGIMFGAAMVAAHADFGPMGFYPLRKSFEQAAKIRYRAIFNVERKRLLKSPVFVIAAAVASFAFTRALAFFPFQPLLSWHKNLPVMEALCWGYFIAHTILLSQVPKKLRYTAAVKAVAPVRFFFLIFICDSISRVLIRFPEEIGTMSIFAGALFFYLVLDVFTTKASLVHATNEGAVVENYLSRLSAA